MSEEESGPREWDTTKDDAIRRDLELILFGAALGQHSRERILTALPSGTIDGDIGVLLDSIREQDAEPIMTWLEDRKCKWDKGQDCVQVILDCLVESKKRRLIIDVLKGLTFLARTSPLEETKARASKLLKQIVEM